MLEEIKDVEASIWISASAGTGKTKSLIDRILALLLNSANPSKILCLTYTKAAATEMLTRLATLVQRFSELSDLELIRELEALGFSARHAAVARALYEKSLIPSEWVQIKTIHSFCFGILEKFPIETGLMPGIALCDDYEKKRLLDEAIEKVIFRKDCQNFSELVSHFTIDLNEVCESHALKFQKFLAKFDNFQALYCDFFSIKNKELLFSKNRDTLLIEELFNGKAQQIFTELAETLRAGGKEDIKKSVILFENAKNPSSDFVYAFLMKNLQLKSSLCSKQLSKIYPDLQEKMQNAAQKALDFCKIKKSYISAEANIAMFSLIEKILFEFNELKRAKHCIDFDDVISMTSGLLNNIDWVMFKIDNSIDHLLIDEAQDTNPEQWEIINTITDEFFANYGSEKTVFVVGDEKQSIYSFQGADVQIFKKMHGKFEMRSKASGQRFHNITLDKSYRTTGNILVFVDDVFKNTKHYTKRSEISGVVDIVNLFESEKSEENSDVWGGKTESVLPITAEKKLAQYIADFIKDAIDSRVFVESKNRAAAASDFMILFQRRNLNTMRETIKALRKNGIPVSGIDRTLLKNEIIVEDLIVLAQFSVFPLDDLACARVLKSPIVGISEDELMNLCLQRGKKSLWEHCLQDTALCRKYNLLELQKIVDRSLTESAYVFFSCALTEGLKEKFISRLGAKCLDALYDFIDVVMAYEKENTASLQSFLKWFRMFGDTIEIKQESFASENCVRLMTVHASKGLQAPFVFLADTHFYNSKSEKILKTDDGILLWNFSPDWRTPELDRLCDRDSEYKAEESRRRLYVALTRAEDYVCILGESQKNRRANCWYELVKSETNKFREITIGGQSVMRFGNFSYVDASEKFLDNDDANEPIHIPDWFYEKLELPQMREEKENQKTEQTIYGECVHFLLSELPKYKTSFEMLAGTLTMQFDLSYKRQNEAQKEVFKLLANENLAFIFDDNSLSEVSVIDKNGKERRIDKIAFLNDDIWIIDFKTGEYHEKVPQEYIEQLRQYKKSVEDIFKAKGYNIKTAILWTSNANLAEINL